MPLAIDLPKARRPIAVVTLKNWTVSPLLQARLVINSKLHKQ
jgi:hypothetical protein